MSLLSYDFSIEELQEWRLHPSIFWRGKVFLGCKLLTIEISLRRTFQEALALYMEDLGFLEDLFWGGQWSIIIGYRRSSAKSLLNLNTSRWPLTSNSHDSWRETNC